MSDLVGLIVKVVVVVAVFIPHTMALYYLLFPERAHKKRERMLNNITTAILFRRWLKESGRLSKYRASLRGRRGVSMMSIKRTILTLNDWYAYVDSLDIDKIHRLSKLPDYGILSPNEVVSYIHSKDNSLLLFTIKAKHRKCLSAIKNLRRKSYHC